MEVKPELIDRIVCAKYLFQSGSEYIERAGTYSDGIAILHLQDSIEMFLRTVAEHLHCSIKETISFNQLIDEIDKAGKGALTHRSALNQLNKARVNFKHFGLQPKHEDVRKFNRDLQAFFPAATRTFLNLDFESLSLINLINHQRVRNFLARAEIQLDSENNSESIHASAVAFELYRNFAGHQGESTRLRVSSEDERKMRDLVRAIQDSLWNQQEQINLIMDGINLGDYRRFKRHIPCVSLSSANTVHSSWHFHNRPDKLTKEDAAFCLRFAIDSILLMQQYRLPPVFRIPFPNRHYVVLKDTKIIVYPGEEQEVIRIAKKGETLQQHYETFNRNDFTAILQDESCAYVNIDDVDLLEESGTGSSPEMGHDD